MGRGEGVSDGHWFEALADHLGGAYLRYSFTKGTAQEVDALVELTGLAPGMRALDVGCGPGRHARVLAARGVEVVGVDISRRFVELAATDAPEGTSFVVGDARRLAFDAEFDVAYSLCQGGFGLLGGPAADPADPDGGDLAVLAGLRRAVRPGGAVVVSAFNAYFQAAHLDGSTEFDAATGVHHERTEIRDEHGSVAEVDLWTTCWTPRELRLAARSVGLDVEAVHGVTPGSYGSGAPSTDLEEFLLVARRPA
ncbi:MAG: class I SAM-dependent methyltransferase [Actinomycetota bacterium]